jgi:SAM-dependent methyltransferase
MSLKKGSLSLVGALARRAGRILGRSLAGDITVAVERYWSDERHRCIQGWIASRGGPVEEVEIQTPAGWIRVRDFVPRPDVECGLPGARVQGFRFQYDHAEPIHTGFRVRRGGRWIGHTLQRTPPDCAEKLEVPDGSSLFAQFIAEVNERKLRVLEIGSRIVSPGSVSKRDLFPGAASFLGFDYYKDDNTDIAGDAHRLSDFVAPGSVDAVFSIAVMEHLAMPWVVAREINRVLAPGGLTYHGTVFGWPAHERPWDFWRLSDEGLKVLFSPALGFETIGAGMFDPVSMHFRELRPGHENFPHAAAYASSAILARKVKETPSDEFRWPTRLDGIVEADSHYPAPIAG